MPKNDNVKDLVDIEFKNFCLVQLIFVNWYFVVY